MGPKEASGSQRHAGGARVFRPYRVPWSHGSALSQSERKFSLNSNALSLRGQPFVYPGNLVVCPAEDLALRTARF